MPSGGKQNSTSVSNQEMWEPWGDAMEPMLENSGAFYDAARGSISNPEMLEFSRDWTKRVQDRTMEGWNQQMQGGNLAGYDISGALAGNMAGGNYSEAYKQNFVNDAQAAQKSMLQGLDGRAAASGMSGGSRHGMATAAGMQDINSNLQSNMANIGYQDYNNRNNMLAGLLGQQNKNQQYGLANSGNMASMSNLGYQAAMSPFMSHAQMMQAMGPSTVLSDSQSSGKSMNFGV